MSSRRPALVVVLGLALVATGALTTLVRASNPSTLPGGLGVASNAESTALYCSGLTSVRGGLAGRVTFLNTTDHARSVVVQVDSDSGHRGTTTVRVGAYSTRSIQPERIAAGDLYGVAAQVNGGGVVAEEVTYDNAAAAPCSTSGVTSWYGSGFDTVVGSLAQLSIFNPTETPAVINVSAYTQSGFSAPAPFQGLAVGGHDELVVDLGKEIVDTRNVGVHVRVLRGSVEVVGVQHSGANVSLDPGASAATTHAWFPSVTTARLALAQVRLANPGSQPADVTLRVALSSYHVPAQSVTVAPYSSGVVVITPNSAIPAAGYAAITLTSSRRVVASLATGTTSGLALSPAPASAGAFLVSDFTGEGFDAATVTNTSHQGVTVNFTTLGSATSKGVSGSVRVDPGATESILSAFSALSSLTGVRLYVTAAKPAIVVTLTLPTKPAGTLVVEPLYDG